MLLHVVARLKLDAWRLAAFSQPSLFLPISATPWIGPHLCLDCCSACQGVSRRVGQKQPTASVAETQAMEALRTAEMDRKQKNEQLPPPDGDLDCARSVRFEGSATSSL